VPVSGPSSFIGGKESTQVFPSQKMLIRHTRAEHSLDSTYHFLAWILATINNQINIK
jgi:hypothetical protein